jgi:hypothetical protein
LNLAPGKWFSFMIPVFQFQKAALVVKLGNSFLFRK